MAAGSAHSDTYRRSTHARSNNAVTSASGLGLVEVMVTMTITLVVLALSIGAFSDALKVNEAASVVSATNQNLRAGMNLMVRDLVQTGEGIPTGGIPVPSGYGVTPIARPGPPGTALTFPTELDVLPALSPGSSLGPIVDGHQTDIVTLLYADTVLPLNETPLAAIAADGSRMTVDPGTPISDIPNAIVPGDLIMFSNALGNAIQQVTRTDDQNVFFDLNDTLNMNQRAASQGTIMQLQSAPGVFPPTTATRITMVTYYIDAVTDPSEPRLVRRLNDNEGRPITTLTDDLQFNYDLVDGVTNPSGLATPVAPNTPHQIRKVNLFLAGRSDATLRQTGQFFRNTLATQVSLRSLSFVDRYR